MCLSNKTLYVVTSVFLFLILYAAWIKLTSILLHNGMLIKTGCEAEIYNTHCILRCKLGTATGTLRADKDCFGCEKGEYYCGKKYGVRFDGTKLIIEKFEQPTLVLLIILGLTTAIICFIWQIIRMIYHEQEKLSEKYRALSYNNYILSREEMKEKLNIAREEGRQEGISSLLQKSENHDILHTTKVNINEEQKSYKKDKRKSIPKLKQDKQHKQHEANEEISNNDAKKVNDKI